MNRYPYEPKVMYYPAKYRKGPACCDNCTYGAPCPTGNADAFTGWAWAMGLILATAIALPYILKK